MVFLNVRKFQKEIVVSSIHPKRNDFFLPYNLKIGQIKKKMKEIYNVKKKHLKIRIEDTKIFLLKFPDL